MDNSTVKPNGLMIAGLIINTLVTLFTAMTGRYPLVLSGAMAIFVLLSFIGLALIARKNTAGLTLLTVGCIIFVPIGIVGVIGVRKYKEEVEKEKLQKSLALEDSHI